MPSLRTAALVGLAASSTACLTARTDARIRHGTSGGLTVTALRTPDAVTFTPDGFIMGVPDHAPAAHGRVHVEGHVAFGWPRVQLMVRPLSLRITGSPDEPADPTHTRLVPTVHVDLYVKAYQRGPWHAGFGLETSPGGYAIGTYEWTARDATSVTVRGVFGGRDGSKAMPRYNTQLQVQASYVRTVGRADLTAFIGASNLVGDGDGSLLYTEPGQGAAQTTYTRAAYAGVSATWW
jgi:hypothetical protein